MKLRVRLYKEQQQKIKYDERMIGRLRNSKLAPIEHTGYVELQRPQFMTSEVQNDTSE